MYDSINNTKWKQIIEQTTQKLAPYSAEIVNWFKENTQNDAIPYLSDIIDALFSGTIETPYNHDRKYWERPGNREREILANFFALDIMDITSILEISDYLKPLYEVWKEIIYGGML